MLYIDSHKYIKLSGGKKGTLTDKHVLLWHNLTCLPAHTLPVLLMYVRAAEAFNDGQTITSHVKHDYYSKYHQK